MFKTLPVVFFAGVVLAACNYPGLQQPSQEDEMATAAAETVSAQLTVISSTQPAPEPTETQAPPIAASDTAIPEPTDTSTPDCENRVRFVQDVTIPDDTNIPAGDTFEKVWRLRNEGTCTWTTDYDVVFDGGNIMAGPPSAPLSGTVPPNGTIDIEISLTAPSSDGIHRGDWKLRSPEGIVFGLGEEGDVPFFVQIVVGEQSRGVVYDFVEEYCEATWRTGAGVLSCPGSDSDAEGFIIKLDEPRLEDGRTENEPALVTHPQWVNNGVISGRFPAFDVEEGDAFRAVIGCLYDNPACDLTMQLNYRENGGDLRTLRDWDEIYDGEFRNVEVDLSDFAGSSVEFVLAVVSNGSSNEDLAFWLAPRIEGTLR